jgi:hypothetical protein
MKMNDIFRWTGGAACGAGAAALLTLSGCMDESEGGVQVEAGVFAPQDDYVYYPNYECYYSISRHQYAYRDDNGWAARPAPRGVSVEVLNASPSVRMNFHDSPAHHHEMMAKQYPKNWKPIDEKQSR